MESDVLRDPYVPPLKTDMFPQLSSMATQGTGTNYTQVGILTSTKSASDPRSRLPPAKEDLSTEIGGPRKATDAPMILPLMGRYLGRDKQQYYTISNTGMMNTKLPIRLKGRSCTGEYGCNEIYSGDAVYVEGYNEEFYVTIYENNMRYVA